MTRSILAERLRQRLGTLGYSPASAAPAAVEGRSEEYRLAPARLIEGSTLRTQPVGSGVPSPHPLAFLDGIQRHEVIGFRGPHPIVFAELAAAVRLRSGRDLRTVIREERRLILAAPELIDAVAREAPACQAIALEDDDPSALHPLRALELARQLIDRERGRLELDVGWRFRGQWAGWIVVDGVLTDSELWAGDRRAIGVSKSHATLPFRGEDLATYLGLPAGHRTSVFEPATWRLAPVHSWGLRLWPWEGRDLLHGLVRVELAAGPDIPARADEVSRWLLAERTPLSRPDPRWDRQLYGVASVERSLRSAR